MRQSTSHESSLYNKMYNPAILLIAVTTMLLINLIDDSKIDYVYPIKETDKAVTPQVINTSYTINNALEISFKNVSLSQSFIFPRNRFFKDNFYLASVASICLFIVVLIYKEHRKGMFNSKLSKFTHLLAYFFVIILTVNTFRWLYLVNKISSVSNGKYKIMHWPDPFLSPEFWIISILSAITFILKKGEKLQEEQSLTI